MFLVLVLKYYYLTWHNLGQEIVWDSLKKIKNAILYFDSMMLLLHMVKYQTPIIQRR